MIQVGDKVRKKNGCSFSNGEKVVTVESVFSHVLGTGSNVTFKETDNTCMASEYLELVEVGKTSEATTLETIEKEFCFLNKKALEHTKELDLLNKKLDALQIVKDHLKGCR